MSIHHDQLPMENEGDTIIVDDDQSSGFVGLQLCFFRVVREEGSYDAELEEVGRRQIQVGLGGVATTDQRPVLDVRRALSELGVTQESHVTIVANILEYINREFIIEAEEEDLPMTVMIAVDVYEEFVGQTPTEINDQQLELDDDQFVSEVARLRQTTLLDDSEIFDDFDMEVEVDTSNLNTMPASEEAIARLEKVRIEEVDADVRNAICMEDEEHERDEEFRRMPCAHLFHNKCVVPWLRTSGSCLLYRFQLP